MLQKFRSADGSSFDFRGDKQCSFNEREGTLANSNERSEKGFVPTSELGKSFGLVGQYKLDWMFILPPNLDKPKHFVQCRRPKKKAKGAARLEPCKAVGLA